MTGTMGESVELDLTRREESVLSGGGGHASGQGAGRGEHSAGQETREVTVQEILLVVAEEKRTGFMHVLYT